MNPTVKQYFDIQPTQQREILKKIRQLIIEHAPLATECMSYGAPAFKLKKNLIMYAAFKQHIGIYPEPATIEVFKHELKDYKTSKGAIQFSLDQPIPYELIKKIILYRYQLLLKANN